jgi:hypothetical protein
MKPLCVIPYSCDWKDSWDDFVRNKSRNGNIFHEQKFLSYHGDRFEDSSILITEEEDILAVIPAAVKREDSRIGIISHPGSSYGGVIFLDNIRLKLLKDILNVAIEYYYKIYKADYFKLIIQENFHTNKSFDALIFLLWHRGFEIKSKEASCVKDLTDLSPDNYTKTIRQYIKSNKDKRVGITHSIVKTTEQLKSCYELIKNNLKNRYDKQPVHNFDELIDLRNRYGEKIEIFCSSFDNQIIASVVVFILDKYTIHDFYTSLNYEYGQQKPLFGLFDYIFHFYKEKGYRFFNFGISSRARWIKWGILEFKEQFGTMILTRDVWRLENLSEKWPYDGREK